MDNELLYKIGITGTESETELLGKLKVALAETTRQINELTKAGKENSRTLNEAVGQELKNQKELQAEIRKVLDIKKIEAAETKRIAAEKSAIIEQARKEAIAELNQRNAIAEANKIEATSIVGMRREALLLTKQMELLNQADRDNINVGGQMRNRIVELDRAIKLHEQSIGNYRRSVGQYNTAGMAMSQVLREIPAFTFSAQTGFLALSNNLPILGDEMKKIANRIDEVTGKKAGWGAAFKDMAKNAISFGGIMTILIGLLPMIIPYIEQLFTGVKKLSEAEEDAKRKTEDYKEILTKVGLAWEEYRGNIDEVALALGNVAIEHKKSIDKIQDDSEKQIKEIMGGWNQFKLWAETFGEAPISTILMFGSAGEEVNRKRDEQLRLVNLNKQTAIQKELETRKLKQDEILLGHVRQHNQNVDDLIIESIENERKRDIKKEEEKLKRTIQGYAKLKGHERAYNAAKEAAEQEHFIKIQEINAKHDEKDKKERERLSEERKKEQEETQKELLALIEQYHDQVIVNTQNEYIKEIGLEQEKHHRIIDELKSHLNTHENLSQQELEINKQVNINIEEEERRHKRALAAINTDLSTTESEGLPDLSSSEKTRKDNADKWLKSRKATNKKLSDEEKQERKQAATYSIDIAKDTAERIAEIKQDAVERQLQRELTAIERNAEGQNAILENRLRNGLITEGQYNDEKQRLNQETARLELEANKKSFDKNKEMSIQLALINGALALIAVMANSKDPTGIYTAIQLGATATATGLQIQQIRATEYAELGGKINGKSHAQGGVLVEAEGDEMIINKKAGRSNQIMSAVGTPSQIASAINSTYGGVSWETTSLTNKPSPNIFSNNTSSEYITFAQMEQLIIRQANMINDKEVFMVESKVTKSQNKVKMYEKNGKF